MNSPQLPITSPPLPPRPPQRTAAARPAPVDPTLPKGHDPVLRRRTSLFVYTALAVAPVAVVCVPLIGAMAGATLLTSTLLALGLALASVLLVLALMGLERGRQRAADDYTLLRRNVADGLETAPA